MTGLARALLLTSFVMVSAGSLQVRGIDGAALRPLEPAGVANVLLFVATDCPVAATYAPEIQHICAAYAGRGVSCTLIYEQADVQPDAVRQHLQDYRYRGIRDVEAVPGSEGARPRRAIIRYQGGSVRYKNRCKYASCDASSSDALPWNLMVPSCRTMKSACDDSVPSALMTSTLPLLRTVLCVAM